MGHGTGIYYAHPFATLDGEIPQVLDQWSARLDVRHEQVLSMVSFRPTGSLDWDFLHHW
jgi:hypothetical protein